MSIKYNNNKRNCSYILLRTKKCYILEKLAVCSLLLGFAYRLSPSSFLPFSSLVDDAASYHGWKPHQASSVEEKCNIFEGEWVEDPTPPAYTNESCRWIRRYKNCLRNGRPDMGYIYWKWKPKQCELPKFNPKRFLDIMINKTFAFVGDSLMRNQMESLLCILSQMEQPIEVFRDKEYHNRRFYFPSHNFTVSVVWSPFLIRADSMPPAPVKSHLDQLDPLWAEQLEKMDYLLIGGGKWFLGTVIYHENNTVIGCHICPGMNLTEIGFDYAYRKSLQRAFEFISSSNRKVFTILRTITPSHFEYGGWNTGGYCNRTELFKAGEIDVDDIDAIMHGIELEEFEKAAIAASRRGLIWKLIDITYLSVLRPDGHPGIYRKFQPFAKTAKPEKYPYDCLHWCLPGPIDAWNYLMMETLSSNLS